MWRRIFRSSEFDFCFTLRCFKGTITIACEKVCRPNHFVVRKTEIVGQQNETGGGMAKTPLIAASAVFLLLSAHSPAQKKPVLTLEEIYGGSFFEPAPSEMRWSPDGKQLAYFWPEEDGERALWVVTPATGEKSRVTSSDEIREMAPSPGQASTGERERTRRTRYDIASFIWAPDGKKFLLASAGKAYLYEIAGRKPKLLAPAKSGILDPKFSPNGQWVSFIYKHDIWVVPTAGGEERQLTFGGNELLLHGDLDWIYQEEFDLRSGYEWSPDNRYISFLELNERAVPTYPITEEISQQATVDLQRYPKAGDPNPTPRIGFVSLENRKVHWIDRNSEYMPRMDWADGKGVFVQLLNRAQKELELVEVNPETGKSRIVLKETDPYWLDITSDLSFLSGGREFLWTSDRTGFRHIYHYYRSGQLIRQFTSGDWVVSGVSGVDEKNHFVYYTSNKATLLGRDLFRSSLDGTGSERVTSEAGTHAILMNAAANAFADSFSSMTRRPEHWVCDLASGKKTRFSQPRNMGELAPVAPEMRELKAADGAVIRLLLLRTPNTAPGKKYPAVVYAYGMPGVPTIQNAWAGNRSLWEQFLVQQGFIAVRVDDRCSAVPGHAHAVAAYHNLGPVAAKDHEEAVRYLRSLPYVDPDALAVWGWSGGGFTAAYHMTHTHLFKAGIAGAPVTDWRLYDSIYTERYMGIPNQDREAYDRASTVLAAPNYTGRLLLIHGTQDDNVHPQNTIQLVHALIENNKQFDLMLYPGKTHGISGAAENIHLYTMIYQFLERNLK
jgi:dipeptidyl-peptidase 4